MDWINCNACFSQPNENGSKLQFYLTSCGHIFCENCGCLTDGTSDCCKRCMNKCSTTLIGEKSFQTNPQVLEYFQEPEDLCEKLLKVMKFQKAHRIKLVGHHQRIVTKYKKAKFYIKKLENELKIAKNALRNTPQKLNSAPENQSFSMSIFDSMGTSSPFKIINSEIKNRSTLNFKNKIPDMKYRTKSFRNELSIASTESTVHGIPTPGSSVYTSPLQENCNENYISSMNNLQLNSFGQRQYRKH